MATPPSTSVELRSEHNLARYCRPRSLAGGILSSDAFLLRTGEQFLSTNWLEYFHQSDRQIQLSGVRAVLAGKGFNVSVNGRFAVLNVGTVRRQVGRGQLRFALLGQANDPSHAGIFGYTADDIDTAGELAESVEELYPAIE